ncbi:MAG TPA: hypothetical protein VGR84_10735 [Candidatus Acidoferrales bacterium]|nr:hypothetical protein [Candidatus Acidoferrales bacterium]
MPDTNLKRRAFERQRQIELLQLSAKVRLQLANRFLKGLFVLHPAGLRTYHMLAGSKADQT